MTSTDREAGYALRSWDLDLSHAEVEARVTGLAGQLQALLEGDDRPVGVLAANSGQTLIAFLATVLSGKQFVPLNVHLGVSELRGMLEDGNPPGDWMALMASAQPASDQLAAVMEQR